MILDVHTHMYTVYNTYIYIYIIQYYVSSYARSPIHDSFQIFGLSPTGRFRILDSPNSFETAMTKIKYTFSMDWFKGKNICENPIFNGKIYP